MKTFPLVSVIVPAYNAANYLSSNIESVLKQDYPNIEIIVINDGSKDKTSEIVAQYSDKITFITQSNSGATVARNRGLSEAKGKYIQFLDADDLLSSEKIGTQVELLEKNEGYITFCETRHFFDGDDHFQKFSQDVGPSVHFNEGRIDPAGFLWHLWGGISPNIVGMVQSNAWLTPKNIIDKVGGWNTDLPNNPDDDGEFFCRIVLNSNGVIFSDKGINYYRKFKNSKRSLSAQKNFQAVESIFKSIENKAHHLLQYSKDEKSYRAIAHQYTNLYYNTYPYPFKISQEARRRMLEFGGPTYRYQSGNRLLQILSPLIHWKIFKLIQFVRYELLPSINLIRGKSKIML